MTRWFDKLIGWLMRPRVRCVRRWSFVATLPLGLLIAHLHGVQEGAGLTYARGTFGLALGFAFTPVVISEAVAMHLLLGGGVVCSPPCTATCWIWLWGLAVGPRACPHRIGEHAALLRAGPMYRVVVPRGAILTATPRRERIPGERGLVER